ncbi:MAG: hypothetical protein R2867_46560 [Caldilineaceae bacterium]
MADAMDPLTREQVLDAKTTAILQQLIGPNVEFLSVKAVFKMAPPPFLAVAPGLVLLAGQRQALDLDRARRCHARKRLPAPRARQPPRALYPAQRR